MNFVIEGSFENDAVILQQKMRELFNPKLHAVEHNHGLKYSSSLLVG